MGFNTRVDTAEEKLNDLNSGFMQKHINRSLNVYKKGKREKNIK